MSRDPRTVLALDVGGTKLAAGVVTADGTVHSRLLEPALREQGPAAMIARHLALGRRAVEAAGLTLDAIDAVGIACGGPLDPFGGVIQAPLHLPGWIDVPLVAIVERELGIRAAVDNDATAGAIAEWRFGAGRDRGVRNLVYLTVSTGIGGGVIADGRVMRGANGNAAELGHLTIDWRGDPCPCGRRGCLETYASGTNIARRARAALEATDAPSALRAVEGGPAAVTAKEVAEAAAAGDPLARATWDETTAMLASAVANILDAFDPELVVIGGGVTRAGSAFIDPVREGGLAQAMGPAREAADVVLATLGEDLGVVAAAAVAFDRFGAAFSRG